jgi:hypothetical protein
MIFSRYRKAQSRYGRRGTLHRAGCEHLAMRLLMRGSVCKSLLSRFQSILLVSRTSSQQSLAEECCSSAGAFADCRSAGGYSAMAYEHGGECSPIQPLLQSPG